MYRARRTKADLMSGITKPIKKAKMFKNGRSTLEIEYEDGSYAVRYHDTDVFTRTAAGTIVLNSGGFRTVTTKERINGEIGQFGLSLYQRNSVWYMSRHGNWDSSILFYDGIEFSKDGELLSEVQELKEDKIKDIKKKIAKYVKLVDKCIEKNGSLPIPCGGDCWDCAMQTEDGKSWGDIKGSDQDHLWSHMKEGYLHGSIIVNAMRERGYRDEQIRMFLYGSSDYMLETVKKCLRRYLKARLLPELCPY